MEKFNALGISTIPVKPDKSPALPSWKEYQNRIPTADEILSWKTKGFGTGIVAGKVSGGLYCIDVDEKYNLDDVKLHTQLLNNCSPDIRVFLQNCLWQSTISGGWHIVFKTDNPTGNESFSSRRASEQELKVKPESKSRVLIESRGEKGMFVSYKVVKGAWDNLPTASQEQFDAIKIVCRSLSKIKPVEKPSVAPKEYTGGLSPLDDWQAQTSPEEIIELLTEHGWSYEYSNGDKHFLRRPGKNKGISAVLDSSFYCYSSSTEFPDHGVSYAGVKAILEHDGDKSALAKELASQGYGEQIDKKEQRQLIDKMLGKKEEPKFTSEENERILSRFKQSEDRLNKYKEYVDSGHSYRLSPRFSHLNPFMRDISPGQVVGIAGASGTGKSLVLDQLNKDYAAVTDTYGVLVTLEMSHADQAIRGAMALGDCDENNQVSKQEVTERLFTSKEFYDTVRQDGSRIATLDDAYNLTEIFELIKVYQQHMKDQGKYLSFISIDFQTLLDGGDNVDKQSDIAQQLKIMAKKLNIIVFTLQQLNGMIDEYEEPFANNISGRKALYQMLDFSFMIWKSVVDGARIFMKNNKERWSKKATIDLVAIGMALQSEEHKPDQAGSVAKSRGNKGLTVRSKQ